MSNRPLSGSAAESGLDRAFEALKTYDWGTDRKAIAVLEEAVVAALGNAESHAALEARLTNVLETGASRDAKDVVCRQLRVLGTAACVPALARLLPDEELSHMARYALERIQDPAAGAALRESLSKVSGTLRAGIAGSLGARRDTQAVPALIGLLEDGDPSVIIAAATALGSIATPEASRALASATHDAPEAARTAVIDAALRAAEALAASRP